MEECPKCKKWTKYYVPSEEKHKCFSCDYQEYEKYEDYIKRMDVSEDYLKKTDDNEELRANEIDFLIRYGLLDKGTTHITFGELRKRDIHFSRVPRPTMKTLKQLLQEECDSQMSYLHPRQVIKIVKEWLTQKRVPITKLNFPSNDGYAINRFIKKLLEELN